MPLACSKVYLKMVLKELKFSKYETGVQKLKCSVQAGRKSVYVVSCLSLWQWLADYLQMCTLLPAWHMQMIVLLGYITKMVNFRFTNLKSQDMLIVLL
jgi:hypothetical protein